MAKSNIEILQYILLFLKEYVLWNKYSILNTSTLKEFKIEYEHCHWIFHLKNMSSFLLLTLLIYISSRRHDLGLYHVLESKKDLDMFLLNLFKNISVANSIYFIK